MQQCALYSRENVAFCSGNTVAQLALKNQDTCPTHLFQQGTNTWINTADFPMVNRYTPYYVAPRG